MERSRVSPVAATPGDAPIHVLVAGVPYSYSRPFPDGRWLTDEHRAAIEAVSPRIRLEHMTRAELEAGQDPENPPEVILTETTGIATDLDGGEWVEHLVRGRDLERLLTPALRWVQSCSHGSEKLLPMLDENLPLVRGKDIHSEGLAESILGAMLFHTKRLTARIEMQKAHRWELLEYGELYRRTLVVVGAGSLGTAVARLAQAFNMHVVGVRRNVQPTEHYDEVVGPDQLDEVLARADYLLVTTPRTPQTENMIAAEQLALLPDHAYVMNVARGEIVNEQDLLDALRDGTVGGAFLDVFVEEPLPADNPLWDAPNTLISPHDAHRSDSVGDRNVALLCDNLRRYIAGEELDGLVDREAGY